MSLQFAISDLLKICEMNGTALVEHIQFNETISKTMTLLFGAKKKQIIENMMVSEQLERRFTCMVYSYHIWAL